MDMLTPAQIAEFQKHIDDSKLINIENKYDSYLVDDSLCHALRFKSFIEKEVKQLKSNETRSYICHVLRNTCIQPTLFFLNSSYLVRLTGGKYLAVLDHSLNLLFSYSPIKKDSELGINFFYGEKIKTYKNEYLNVFMYPLRKNVSLVLNLVNNDENQFVLDMPKSKAITSITFEKEEIIVKFKGSFYSKMILDYDYKIKTIDFHGSTKKKLSIETKINNVNNYSHLLSSLSENFELYSLLNDANFDTKMKEVDFNNHLEIIKTLVEKRSEINQLSNQVTSIFESIKPNAFFGETFMRDFDINVDGKRMLEEQFNIKTTSKKETERLFFQYKFLMAFNEIKNKKIEAVDVDTINKLLNIDNEIKKLTTFVEKK